MESIYEQLKQKLEAAFEEIRRDRLPNWEAVFFSPEVHPWMLEQENKVFQALEDEADIRFAQALAKYKSGWVRINQQIAEKYKAANPDPTTWELRYLKHMRVKFIRCESPAGEFYITPRPRKPKKGVRTISADQLEAIIENPVAAKAFELFGALPVDESEFDEPPKGENHLHFYPGLDRPFRTKFNRGDFYGRKSFRGRPFPDDPEAF